MTAARPSDEYYALAALLRHLGEARDALLAAVRALETVNTPAAAALLWALDPTCRELVQAISAAKGALSAAPPPTLRDAGATDGRPTVRIPMPADGRPKGGGEWN